MRYVLALLFSLVISPAFAGVSCVLPFNLQNGTTADATQVMANYNALVACLGNAAAAGANSDITSLNALTTPIPHSAGGSWVYVGGTSTGSASAQVLSSTVPAFTLTTGAIVAFQAGFNVTGPTTFNVASSGALTIYRHTQIGLQQLVGGEFLVNDRVLVQYDGSFWECLSCNRDTVGQIMDYAGTGAPSGWIAMDGSCQSQATYAALFQIVGTNYGSCSAGQFALPDGRGNAMVGLDNQGGNGNANRLSICPNHTTLGALCGVQSQTITQANLPSVGLDPTGLSITSTTLNSSGINVCNGGSCTIGAGVNLVATTQHSGVQNGSIANISVTSSSITGTVPLGGSGSALTTIQPLQFIYKIIKL